MVGEVREPSFLILTALSAGELHGYGIVQEIATISDGRVQMGTGTLYGALERLQSDALVEATREETVDGRLRRYYRITKRGTEVLRREVVRHESNVRAARVRLAGAS